MGWDKHKLLWDGTDKYVPLTTLEIIHMHVIRESNHTVTKLPRNGKSKAKEIT